MRNMPKKDAPASVHETTQTADKADAPAQAMPGGAPGVEPQQGEVGAQSGAATSALETPKKREGEPKPKRYRVLNGGHVMYKGCRVAVRAGKEVSDATFDLKVLRSQGIKLEEIKDDAELSAVG